MLQDVIALLGIANPQLAPTWQDGGLPTEDSGLPMRLINNANGEWHAPAAGLFNQEFAKRLSMPDGSTPAETTWVLVLHPQVFLRLARLYGRVIEGPATAADPPTPPDQLHRPVPKYFAFHDTQNVGDGPKAGTLPPNARLQLTGGSMTVHDEHGQPIHPLAIASAFVRLMTSFPALVAKDSTSPTPPNIQLTQLADSGQAELRVRIVTLFRKPFVDGTTKLTNLTAVEASVGLYLLANQNQPVAVVSPPVSSNERLVVGAATFGTLDSTFTPRAINPQLPALRHDFLNLFADDLNRHLRSAETLPAPFAGPDFQVPTYHNETVSLLFNGNQVLAQAGQNVSNADGLSLVVSPVIASDFSVAAAPDVSEWPDFPGSGDGVIAGRLQDVIMSAHFLPAPADRRDVFLSMEIPETSPGVPQLSPGTAVRIYSRKFLPDAREGRGNGAGGVIDADRRIGFVLVNPLGLRRDEALPVNPKLLFDLIAVNRTGSKRSFGLLGTTIDAPRDLDAVEAALADRGTNPFNNAPERGVGPAGLLGLPGPSLSGIPDISNLATAVDVALDLGDEAQPRAAPRLPTMTRNECIVAGRDNVGDWSSVLSGLWVRRDSRSSLHRVGSPGSPGGEEFFSTGFQTSGGLLAYDIARAALRRTRGLAERLTTLGNDARWTPPVIAPTGTFSVALLQNISPGADSPNLKLIPDSAFNNLPDDWPSLVNAVGSLIPQGLASNAAVRNAITSLANNPQGVLLYSEFRREAFTARHGRRDSLPLIRGAIKSACDLIYIETSAFSFTDYKPNNPGEPENANDPPNPDTDLISLIAKQMEAQPDLKVLICVSKEFLAGIGYESFAGRAYNRRIKALEKLQALDRARVTLFHPIGFPGRPLRLMHNLVIVDDVWLFMGTGSFTRRGLLFDGNFSVAGFDRQIEAGRSRAIRQFRRTLLESHLNARPIPGSPLPAFPHPNIARLADLHEAYFAVRDTLDQGGSGLIEAVWDGTVTGQTPIPPESFPHRDLADPDGSSFPSTMASLLQVFAGLGDSEA